MIWGEWLQEALRQANEQPEEVEEPWRWGRLRLMMGVTPLKYHVLVSPDSRNKVRTQLRIRSTQVTLQVQEEQMCWVPLCEWLRAARFEQPDGATSNELIICSPLGAKSVCKVCASRARKALWRRVPPVLRP